MKRNRRWGAISWLIVPAVMLSVGLIVYCQQTAGQDVNVRRSPREMDKNRYPVINFQSPFSDDNGRDLKDKRYQRKTAFLISDPDIRTTGIGFDDHSLHSDDILRNSSLVVIGQVIRSEAFITRDKRNIYSEFTIRVDEILKPDPKRAVVFGEAIVADRMGGRVKYPSGSEVTYFVMGLDMPKVGMSYIFFLNGDAVSPNYKIMTGYEFIESPTDADTELLDIATSFENWRGGKKSDLLKRIKERINDEPTKVQKGVMTDRQREHSKLYNGRRIGAKKLTDFGQEKVDITIGSEYGNIGFGNPLTLFEYIRQRTCEADLVITGIPISKESQLTPDEDFIFTDFLVSITNIWKNDEQESLKGRTDVVVSRPGGKVDLNGNVMSLNDSSNQLLMIGNPYLLFLKRIPSTRGYVLTEGSTFIHSDGRLHQFSQRSEVLHGRSVKPTTDIVKSFANNHCSAR